MKTMNILIALSVISIGLVVPPQVYAADANNFIWGADSTGTTTGLKGSRSQVTIQSSTTHSFAFTGEDHNYHLEQWGTAAGSTYMYLVGYFVNESDPTKAYCFAEVFKSGLRQDFFECSTAYTHGTDKVFAIHKPGNTVTFYDGTSSTDDFWSYNTGNTDSMSNSNIWALAEKICPPPGTCDGGALGDSPTVFWDIAMQYTTSSTYGSTGWSDIAKANAAYITKPSQSESSAKTEMCTPMTPKGNIQAPTILNDNELSSQDYSGVTCTSETADLWS